MDLRPVRELARGLTVMGLVGAVGAAAWLAGREPEPAGPSVAARFHRELCADCRDLGIATDPETPLACQRRSLAEVAARVERPPARVP